ncbi:MAG: hypothetical protein L0I24_25375, partial [Pseudonocardia sp.]|nr:hypothetical protein [Pseudonocardia sp.]
MDTEPAGAVKTISGPCRGHSQLLGLWRRLGFDELIRSPPAGTPPRSAGGERVLFTLLGSVYMISIKHRYDDNHCR